MVSFFQKVSNWFKKVRGNEEDDHQDNDDDPPPPPMKVVEIEEVLGPNYYAVKRTSFFSRLFKRFRVAEILDPIMEERDEQGNPILLTIDEVSSEQEREQEQEQEEEEELDDDKSKKGRPGSGDESNSDGGSMQQHLPNAVNITSSVYDAIDNINRIAEEGTNLIHDIDMFQCMMKNASAEYQEIQCEFTDIHKGIQGIGRIFHDIMKERHDNLLAAMNLLGPNFMMNNPQ